MNLSQTDFARDWLAQFSATERSVASQLADAVMLVSHDALYRGLRSMLDEIAMNREEGDQDRPIALFAERAVETREIKDGDYGLVRCEVLPFFPGTDKGRAAGAGIPPIVVGPDDQEVGSEGAIANFITGYERLHRNRVLNHPGPDALRIGHVSHIVVVTDFVGSGKRVWEMLEAFWCVATIRSWHSYGLVRFAVIAYSGTEDGLKRVRSHRSGPTVHVVHASPTISTAFVGAARDAVEALCRTHPHKSRYPFGFRGAGALIAFSHGMPNNAPADSTQRSSRMGAALSQPQRARRRLAFSSRQCRCPCGTRSGGFGNPDRRAIPRRSDKSPLGRNDAGSNRVKGWVAHGGECFRSLAAPAGRCRANPCVHPRRPLDEPAQYPNRSWPARTSATSVAALPHSSASLRGLPLLLS